MSDHPSEIIRMTVRTLTAAAVPSKEIAVHVGLTQKLLREHYGDDLKNGKSWFENRIKLNIAKKALGGDARCMIEWMRQYGGWMNVSRTEITGKDGQPISIAALDSPSLDQLIKTLSIALSSGESARRAKEKTIDGSATELGDMETISWSSD